MYFEIEGEFVAKQRPRFANGHTYTPKKTKDYEKRIKLAYSLATREMFFGPVQVGIIVNYKIPQSWSKKKKEQAKKGEVQPTVKPDIDNIAKTILDGLNGYAYDDDKQVVKIEITKKYAEKPSVFVVIDNYKPKER